MQVIPHRGLHGIQQTEQHHEKATINVQVYQKTKLDAQGHTTDINYEGDGSTAFERSVTIVTRGLNQTKHLFHLYSF